MSAWSLGTGLSVTCRSLPWPKPGCQNRVLQATAELSLGENAQHSPLSSLSHQTVPHSLPSVDVAVTPHRTVTPSKNQGDSGGLEASVLPSIIWSLSASPFTTLLWPAGTFSAFHRIYKTSFRVPFPYRLTLLTACPPRITLCGRDNYTLGKQGIGPPGTCLRERCSVPCDQSSEGLTSAPVYFRAEALGWYKVRAPCQAGPWWQVLLRILLGNVAFPQQLQAVSHIFLTLTK